MWSLVRTCGDQKASLRIYEPRNRVWYAAACNQYAVVLLRSAKG